MTKAYDDMINEAAPRLAAALRNAPDPGAIHVWAVFTQSTHDGYISIHAAAPGERIGDFECVRPPAHYYGRWASVPYSCQRSALHEALRHCAILPRERPAPVAYEEVDRETVGDHTMRLSRSIRVF